MSEMLHVFEVSNEGVIAATPERALDLYLDEDVRTEGEEPDVHQLPDQEIFSYSADGGDSIEEKTCAEWAIERGEGWFAREL